MGKQSSNDATVYDAPPPGSDNPTGHKLVLENTPAAGSVKDSVPPRDVAADEATMKKLGTANFKLDVPDSKSDFPDTAAGRQARELLNVFNQGDPAKLKEFLEKNAPSQTSQLPALGETRGQSGGFDLRKIEPTESGKMSALLQEKFGDNIARLQFNVDPEHPDQIKDLKIDLAGDTEFNPTRWKHSEIPQAMDEQLNADAKDDKFSGAVAIAKDGKVVYENAIGQADRDNNTPDSADTKFRIASMGKMLTAVAVIQLAEEGAKSTDPEAFKLDDKVSKYLKDFPDQDLANKITIRELLMHTAGTNGKDGQGNYLDDPEFKADPKKFKTIDDYLNNYGSKMDNPEMRGKFAYSNMGFMMLGKVIEKVSGQSYDGYVKEHILDKAGMPNTGYEPEGSGVQKLAKPYTKNGDGTFTDESSTLPYRGSPAGGAYSTVGDMLRFAEALTRNKLLSPEHTLELTTPKPETGNQYGYGFFTETENGVRSFGHSGGSHGMNGELKIYPDSGYSAVVLSNQTGAARHLSDFINHRLPAN